MKYAFYVGLLYTMMISCNKKEFFDGVNFFEDDFESYLSSNELIDKKAEKWTIRKTTNQENEIIIDTSITHTGQKALKFYAKKTIEGKASKCSISKQHMAFWNNETIRVSAWYYIEGTNSLEWLFLMDLEEQIAVGTDPGMRLALVNNSLAIEYKFLENNIIQSEENAIKFPRNKWVEIVWEMKLSSQKKGTIKLWQNGELIFDVQHKNTLPKDFLYFQQGTKDMYSSVEFGITANTKDNDLVIWIDDIKIEKLD